MESTTVLICDNNPSVHESLAQSLKEANIQVLSAYDGEEALHLLQYRDVQLLILEMVLPDKPGAKVLSELRKFSEIPVLILSSKSSEFDRILGLELGADDYVTKPFSPREVATRVQVILKRCLAKSSGKKLVFTNLTVDRESYTAYIDNQPLDCTPKELEMLALFVSNPGVVLSRDRILGSIWGYGYYSDARAVDAHIKRIRQKLPGNAKFEIASVYGVGYKLVAKLKPPVEPAV